MDTITTPAGHTVTVRTLEARTFENRLAFDIRVIGFEYKGVSFGLRRPVEVDINEHLVDMDAAIEEHITNVEATLLLDA